VAKRKHPQGQRRRPGRPEGVGNSRKTILSKASILFAKNGYAATSLREIAEEADVTTALVVYYFKSKEALLKAIMTDHGLRLASERLKRLASLRQAGGPLDVRDIVLALVSPLAQQMPMAQHVLKIQAWLFLEPVKFAAQLRHKLYDETNREFIAALSEALPHIPARTVRWRFLLSVGAYLYVSNDPKRLHDLEGSKTEAFEVDEYVAQLTAFIRGGLQADPIDKV
jgi:AcrR family transcriptional regulator